MSCGVPWHMRFSRTYAFTPASEISTLTKYISFSFMVPSATGTMALPIALGGKASWRLPVYGFFVAVACGVVSWLFWGTVQALDLQFWLTV